MTSQIEYALECKYQPAWRKEVASRKTVMYQKIKAKAVEDITVSERLQLDIISLIAHTVDRMRKFYNENVNNVYPLSGINFDNVANFSERCKNEHHELTQAIALIPFIRNNENVRILNGKFRRGIITLGEYTEQLTIVLGDIAISIVAEEIETVQ